MGNLFATIEIGVELFREAMTDVAYKSIKHAQNESGIIFLVNSGNSVVWFWKSNFHVVFLKHI